MNLRRRIRNAALGILLVLLLGTLGYKVIGQGRWSFFDSFYMTVISVTSVGFAEVLPLHTTRLGRPFTALLILSGMGVILYFISTFTAFLIEGDLLAILWRRRMERSIKRQTGHIIVCGAGQTGIHVIRELLESRWDIVVVDQHVDRLRDLQEQLGDFPALDGDATEDTVLERAGIKTAKGIICALPSDKDNLFITVTARQLSPEIRIVAKGIDLQTAAKLRRAGADRVVSPNYIGGQRLAAEIIRPQVVNFLELMMLDKERNLRIEEVTLDKESPYAGKQLKETGLRQKAELLVLAVLPPGGDRWRYNPPPDYRLEALSTLIVLGATDSVRLFREHCATEALEQGVDIALVESREGIEG